LLAAVTEAAGAMRVRDVPEPDEPGPGEVLVRPAAVGICGSDGRSRSSRCVRADAATRAASGAQTSA
jgi:NADPH:quinone reductase-like Zn-dependent oxidoreductase